jgi:hypothetical protein
MNTMDSPRLLLWAEQLLAKAEPRLKERADTFLDSKGDDVYSGLKTCSCQIGDASITGRFATNVAAAVREIEHRRSQKVE